MDILALCRKMVILFFCMATGFAARQGRRDGPAEQQKALRAGREHRQPHADPRLRADGEHLLSNGETLRLAGLIVLIYLGLIALSFPAAKVLRVKGSEAGLYRFMFIFSNTGFLGYPIVESLLGYQATFYVTLFVLFFQLFCWSYGASLIRGEARFRFQWQVLRQPCVAASLAALAIYLAGWAASGAAAPGRQVCRRHHEPDRHADRRAARARADALRADLRQLADLRA